MPTIMRLDGLRVVIYPADHPPAHVHVIGAGKAVVVNLLDMEIREAFGCSEPDARDILQSVKFHRETLLLAWRRIHG